MEKDIVVIGLLVAFAVSILVVTAGFVIFVRRYTKDREAINESLIQRYSSDFDYHAFFQVRTSSSEKFSKLIKFFPWQCNGVVFVGKKAIHLVIRDKSGQDEVFSVDISNVRIMWVGRNFWPNGGLFWFVLQLGDKEFYVTSESGMTIMNSEASTRLIFDNLKLGDVQEYSGRGREKREELAIEAHPLTLSITILLFALLGFSIIDGIFINDESAVSVSFCNEIIAYSLATLLVSSILVFKSKVPNLEGIILSFLLALTIGISVYPAALRINQYTDKVGLNIQPYRVDSISGTLTPVNAELPHVEVDLRRMREYWEQFEEDSVYNVHIRKGGLGFYQINMAPIYKDSREYYRAQRREQGPNTKSNQAL